jgi:hypothetical protein
MQDEFNETYISIAVFAQLRLAPLYCALVSKRRYLFFILSLGLLIVVGTVAAETISPYTQNDIADSSETIHFISICFMVSIISYRQQVRELLLKNLRKQTSQ